MLIEYVEMADTFFAEERARHRAVKSVPTELSLTNKAWK